MSKEKISYIILTYNRAEILAEHIVRLKSMHPKELEIIVADDGSGDSIQIMCERYLKQGIIRKYVNTGNHDKATPSQARNLGIEVATGDLLIFADDDCLPHYNLIEQFSKLKKGYVGVGYKKSHVSILALFSDDKEEIVKSMEGMAATLYFQRYLTGNFNAGHFTSGSFAIWREDLGDTRFDEDFVGYGYEDKHFGYLLEKKGLKFDYMIRAMSYHARETTNRPRSQKDEEAQINKQLLNEKLRK